MTDQPVHPGRRVVDLAVIATSVFVVVQVLAAAIANKAILAVAVAVSLALFVAGVAVYLWAFLHAVGRSRSEEIDLGGLFLLADVPAPVRRVLGGAWALQVVVAIATAAVRPFSSVAFGVLAPLFGGALSCLWASVHGEFPPRGQSRRELRTAREPEQAGPVVGQRRRRWFDPVDLDEEDARE